MNAYQAVKHLGLKVGDKFLMHHPYDVGFFEFVIMVNEQFTIIVKTPGGTLYELRHNETDDCDGVFIPVDDEFVKHMEKRVAARHNS